MGQMSKEYKAAWYQANKARLKSLRAVNRAQNKERINATLAAYRAAHPELILEIKARWRAKNRAYAVAKCAERYAKKTQATPKWANRFFIDEAYHLARLRTKMLGFPWHVDHIVPLRSKLVCGLHVENNLQVIPGRANHLKNNRHWPDMA